MRRRPIAILLALVMLATLVACNASASPTAATSTSPTAGTSSTPAESSPTPKSNYNPTGYPIVDEPITITCWMSTGPQYWPENDGNLLYWRRLAELTNINIEWTVHDWSDDNAFPLYLASGDYLDWVLVSPKQEIIDMYCIEGKAFEDVSGYLAECMPNLLAQAEKWPNLMIACTQADGGIYTVPRLYKTSTSVVSQNFYRTDMLQATGLPEPKTVDELYNVLKAVKDMNLCNGNAPLLPLSGRDFWEVFCQWLFPAFGDLTFFEWEAKNGEWIYTPISDQYRRYLEFMNKLWSEGLIQNDIYTIDTSVSFSRAKSGEVFLGTSNFTTIMPNDGLNWDSSLYTGPADEYDANMDKNRVPIDAMIPLTSQWNSVHKIAEEEFCSRGAGLFKKGDEEKLKAILRMMDVAYATEDPDPTMGPNGSGLYGPAINMGFLNETYEVDSATNTYEFLVPENSEWSPPRSLWEWVRQTQVTSYTYGICDFPYINKGVNAFERETAYAEKNMKYTIPSNPIIVMTANEIESYGTANADCQEYHRRMVAEFITGQTPLNDATWKSYVDEMHKMGLQKWIDARNAALDRVLKR